MTVEELKAGFARLAEPVVAAEDPYGRLLSRARRSHRTRLLGWLSGVAAALVAALVAPLLLVQASGPSPTPSPTLSPGVDDLRGAPITPWIRHLMNTPARGSLAGDMAFLSTLIDELNPRSFGFSPELDQRTVLFAGDTGGYRAVLVVFSSGTDQEAVWLIGDAGEDAANLAADANSDRARESANPTGRLRTTVIVDELRPFAATGVADPASDRYLAIGLAPQGCRIATKEPSDAQAWHDSANGDYLVRTDKASTEPSFWARVTCDGAVRQLAPFTYESSVRIGGLNPTGIQLDAALAGLRGTPADRTQVSHVLTELMLDTGVSADNCRVLYSGPIPGTGGGSSGPGGTSEPPVLAAACPTSHGNTVFETYTSNSGGIGGYTRMKLADPHAVFLVPGVLVTANGTTGDERTLVLAPPGATLLQVVSGGTLAGQQVTLTDGIGSIVVPHGQVIQVRALDAAGTVVGTGTGPVGSQEIPEELLPDYGPTVDDWY